MTTITVKDNIIAADGQLSASWITKHDADKIFLVDGDYYGFSGKVTMWEVFLDWIKTGREPYPDMEKCRCICLTKKGRLYLYEEGLGGIPCAVSVGQPYAIGSGGTLAMGAMVYGASAVDAIKAISKVDSDTNDNVKSFLVEGVR